MEDFFYRKLKVYHRSIQLVVDVYALSKLFPPNEQYALTSQIQRAVVSIPSNIAEGMGRFSIKERIHFIEIACGSLMETMCQLEVAMHLGYISTSQLEKEDNEVAEINRMLIALRKSLEEKNNNQ